ncbi:hypothetical protein GCM10007973_22710 [Polymorphobacter multimanifer]|uniref:DUF4893 domain-containing protein n=1 Tax=Polymorphobacter multimanifer TaxID=1070431 RepID=A0A841LIY4_9SPHN|nr:DUF4893 domain-containing protein [Polymorphobacter multimanifer]MBB6228918.1 hypothetical protein [Polymorphobacter multimanifer]GGI85633.1 hypothetical protein GCM10007973_22710 [Polymorphobacter multimanifer]
MRSAFSGALPALLLLMAASAASPVAAQPAATSWQGRIQAEDRTRMAGLWRAWTRSLADIDAAGGREALAALGPVAIPPVEPLPGRRTVVASDTLPPPGEYECRTIRMGTRDDGWPRDGVLPLQVGDWGACAVGASHKHAPFALGMSEGAQQLSGGLWPDGDRMVFLGALALAGEPGQRAYGDDPDRDHLGVLRALGPDHWRLELPWPRWQSNLLLVEMRRR